MIIESTYCSDLLSTILCRLYLVENPHLLWIYEELLDKTVIVVWSS